MSAMNYLVDSITEFYKNQPFDINQVEIIPFKHNSVSPPTKGMKVSPETLKLMSEVQKGKKRTEETKKKLSDVKKGIKLSENHKKAVSIGLMGHTISDETKRKISLAIKGRKLIHKRCIKIKTPKGIFPSTSQAADAYNVSKPTIKTWALMNKNGFSIVQD
jgi:hypothetical protein